MTDSEIYEALVLWPAYAELCERLGRDPHTSDPCGLSGKVAAYGHGRCVAVIFAGTPAVAFHVAFGVLGERWPTAAVRSGDRARVLCRARWGAARTMSGQLIAFPAHRSRGVVVRLTKRELAARWKVSVRWIEERQRCDGLPYEKDAHSRLVRYDLARVEAWRAARLSA